MNTNVSGILVLNKPPRVSSRQALDCVSRLFPRVKMGHAGTLDPLATGVLVICMGKATRLIQYVQRMRKAYQMTLRLGFRSDTHDLEGVLQPALDSERNQDTAHGQRDNARGEAGTADRSQRVDLALLESCLARYRGELLQVPPQYSAVHVGGRRAYELARTGQEFLLQPRRIRIDHLVCTRFEYPDVDIELECSSGTYVRSLVRDIGDDLGCGAVMTQLTRTRIGVFRLDDAHNPNQLRRQLVLQSLRPIADALQELPTVRLPATRIEDIRHGRLIDSSVCDRNLPGSTECTLVDETGLILAVAKVDETGRFLHPHTVLQ